MTFGNLIRNLLGPKLFPSVGRLYRSLFMDLEKVIDHFPDLTGHSRVLDIGGGDGEIINSLLAKYPHLAVTMIDIASSIGQSIRPEFRDRVTCLKNTHMRDFIETAPLARHDVILLSCVIHHVPKADRDIFFSDLRDIIGRQKSIVIIVDVEPGYVRSVLGLWSDRFITGDRLVSPVSRQEVFLLAQNHFPHLHGAETGLFTADRPNYCLYFA